MTHEEFITLVKAMREAQKNYSRFNTQKGYDKMGLWRLSKQLEKQVDEAIRGMEK